MLPSTLLTIEITDDRAVSMRSRAFSLAIRRSRFSRCCLTNVADKSASASTASESWIWDPSKRVLSASSISMNSSRFRSLPRGIKLTTSAIRSIKIRPGWSPSIKKCWSASDSSRKQSSKFDNGACILGGGATRSNTKSNKPEEILNASVNLA